MSRTTPRIIGIDAGGTKVRGVLMQGNRILKRAEKLHGVPHPTRRIFVASLVAVLDGLMTKGVRAIGIGLPGIVANNRVVSAGNVHILAKLDIKSLIRKQYQVRVVIDNDAKAALRAEARQFPDSASVFMLTLGTGIGGAWRHSGKIMKGSFGSAYELGQMVVDKKQNHFMELENFCSRTFFRTKGFNPLESERRARAGTRRHKQLWKEFGENLGIALSNVANLIEPEIIVIGGGLNHAWPLFIPATKKTFKKLVLSPLASRKTRIIKAKLGKWSGAIGAAMSAKQPTP